MAVAQVQHAVKRLKAFVSIGHSLSESYVRRLGRSVNDTSALRALASHIVRIDVLASSVTAMKRSFECGGIEMGDQLSSLLVRQFNWTSGPMSKRCPSNTLCTVGCRVAWQKNSLPCSLSHFHIQYSYRTPVMHAQPACTPCDASA